MAALAVTVIDHHSRERTCHRFPASPVRIGRDPSNDLHLPHPFVSRWHAVVRFAPGAATLYVLAGGNGVLAGGKRLVAGATLTIAPRAVITLGPLELAIEVHADEHAADLVHGATLTGEHDDAADPAALAHRAIARLRPLRAAARAADERWHAAVEAELAALTDPEAQTLVHAELTAWGPLPPGARLDPRDARDPSADPWAPSPRPAASPDAAAELAARLLPGHRLPEGRDEGLRLGRRAAEVLHLFAHEAIVLDQATHRARAGLDLDDDVAPRLPASPERLLEFLLADRDLTDLTPDSIAAVFADARAHARALASSALALGDELARRLDPDADTEGAALPAPGWLALRRRWRALRERHHALVGDPQRRLATLRALLREAYRSATTPGPELP